MTLSLKEFSTFKKFMMLTTSENDSEALLALRRANEVIRKAGVTWDDILSRVVKIELPFESVSDDDSSDTLEMLFGKAMKNARGDLSKIIDDIYDKWQKNNYLSPKQRELIEKTARGEWRR